MLTKVEISTDQGATLELLLGDPSNGYLVKEIEGLDPVKATIVSSSRATMDGEQYQSSRRESRNILLKLGLDADQTTETVRTLRKRLYSYLMPKSNVRLRFHVEEGDGDDLIVDIYARVESFDSPSFTKEPEATISLICHQPDFYVPTPVVLSGMTVADSTEFIIDYEGSVETGILISMLLERDLSEFVVHHRPADGSNRSLQFSEPLLAGDILDISTVSGQKGAIRTRGGLPESVLYGVSPYSNWITLFPGPNAIRVYSEGAPVPFLIEYTTKIGAI